MTPVTDIFDLLDALDGDDEIVLGRCTLTFDEPVILPDRPLTIRGAGLGQTELRFEGDGVDGVIATRSPASPFEWQGPIQIRDLSITCNAVKGGTGLRVRYPEAAVTLDKSLIVERVCVRPANTCRTHPEWWRGGGWSKGIELTNCHGAELRSIQIHGHNGEIAPKDLKAATLKVGLDVGASMCVSVLQPEIMNCGRAMQSIVTNYQGEGLCVIGPGFLMNCLVGIWAENTKTDRPIPSLQVRGMHVYAHTHGIVAIGRSSVDIAQCELSRHHLSSASDWFYGLYLNRAENIRLTGNAFYSGKAKASDAEIGTGLIAVQSSNATLTGNVFSSGLALGAVLEPGVTGFVGAGNRWAARFPIVNNGGRENVL